MMISAGYRDIFILVDYFLIFVAKKTNVCFCAYRHRNRSPQPPLRRGGIKFNSSPFLRGIEGDLLELLTIESNS
jgi:hypothetical protein